MISMCGKRSAMLVSVMDGQRPQIRCEGRWRAPYIKARYGAASTPHRRCVSHGSDGGARRR